MKPRRKIKDDAGAQARKLIADAKAGDLESVRRLLDIVEGKLEPTQRKSSAQPPIVIVIRGRATPNFRKKLAAQIRKIVAGLPERCRNDSAKAQNAIEAALRSTGGKVSRQPISALPRAVQKSLRKSMPEVARFQR